MVDVVTTPPEHGGGDALHAARTDPMTPHDEQYPCLDDGHGHDLRPEPWLGPGGVFVRGEQEECHREFAAVAGETALVCRVAVMRSHTPASARYRRGKMNAKK